MCELLQGFRDRCCETEKKLQRSVVIKRRRLAEAMKPQNQQQPRASVKGEHAQYEMIEPEEAIYTDVIEECNESIEHPDPQVEAADTHWTDEECGKLEHEQGGKGSRN